MQATRGLISLSSKKNPTFSDSKKVFFNISNAIRGSHIQSRGRSFAAAVPSDSSKSERRQKRIKRLSEDERRVMVESFVDKYMALNGGKYPKPSAAHKEVGGSYYIVKKILQELEYQSKISPCSESSQKSLRKEVPKLESQPLPQVEEVSILEATEDLKCYEPSLREEVPKKESQPLPKVEEVSSSEATEDSKCYVPSLSKDDSSTVSISNDNEAKQQPPISSSVEKPVFKEDVIPTSRGDDSNRSERYSHQIGLKKEVMQESRREALESDKAARDISGVESKEDAVPKRSTLWGNLRSLADGVMKLWRK